MSVVPEAAARVETAVSVMPRFAAIVTLAFACKVAPPKVMAAGVAELGIAPSCESALKASVPAFTVMAPVFKLPNAMDDARLVPIAAVESVRVEPLIAAIVVPAAKFAPVMD